MAHVNAKSIYRAVKGGGTDETVLIDSICPCTNEEIEALKEAYNDSMLSIIFIYPIKTKFQTRFKRFSPS